MADTFVEDGEGAEAIHCNQGTADSGGAPVRRKLATNPNAPGRRPALRAQAMQWEREYWDTFMRDEKQEKTAIRYIESNPVNARLCATTEGWPFTSAQFRDQDRQLVIPKERRRPVPR